MILWSKFTKSSRKSSKSKGNKLCYDNQSKFFANKENEKQ